MHFFRFQLAFLLAYIQPGGTSSTSPFRAFIFPRVPYPPLDSFYSGVDGIQFHAIWVLQLVYTVSFRPPRCPCRIAVRLSRCTTPPPCYGRASPRCRILFSASPAQAPAQASPHCRSPHSSNVPPRDERRRRQDGR
ncbi:hypothetical protein EI94DRAFT_1746910, partial [Lactarius quietus]